MYKIFTLYVIVTHSFSQAARPEVALWWSAIKLSLQTTVSQSARVLPLARIQSEHARCVSAACFQNVSSPWQVWKKLLNASMQAILSALAASGPLTLGSCMCLWDLCTEFHSIISWQSCSNLCCMTVLFLTGNDLEQRKHEASKGPECVTG